jgi:hypothetical protein
MDKYGFINQEMADIAVNYELGAWTSEKRYPYFVGEFTEEPITTEDGGEETTLILSGFNRGKYINLEEAKKKIKKHFPAIEGLRASIDSGAIAVFFDGAFPISTGEAEFHRIEIHLKIKEWKGDL